MGENTAPIHFGRPGMPLTHDSDGRPVIAGDVIMFSYGTPGVRVEAKIADIKGELYAMTPGHTPTKCKLKDLRRYVGEFWKIRGTV